MEEASIGSPVEVVITPACKLAESKIYKKHDKMLLFRKVLNVLPPIISLTIIEAF